jgi:hypothetical protein
MKRAESARRAVIGWLGMASQAGRLGRMNGWGMWRMVGVMAFGVVVWSVALVVMVSGE